MLHKHQGKLYSDHTLVSAYGKENLCNPAIKLGYLQAVSRWQRKKSERATEENVGYLIPTSSP